MAKGDIRSGSVSYNSSTGAITSTNLQTYALPGDLLIALLGTANEAGGNRPPTTFSEIVEVSGSPLGTGTPASAGAVRGEVHVARFTAANENTVDWGDSGDHNVRLRWIVEGSWAGIPTLIDASSVSSGTTIHAFPTLTGVPAGSVVYHVAFTDRDFAGTTNFSSWSSPNLASITEIHDQSSTAGFGGGIAAAGGIATSGGTVDGATVTAATSDTCILYSLAISLTESVSETPGVAAWEWTGYAPTVSAGGGTSVSETPGVEAYEWTTYAPTVSDFTPTVARPAGAGDVDTSATVVTDAQSLTPTIELFGDPETNDNITGDKWEGFYATVDLKQAGRTPTFKLDFSNWRQTTPPTNNPLYWRYGSDIGDMSAWAPFDNRSAASSVLTFYNNSAFTESTIQVANIPPVPYEELEDWLTTWDANANIFRPQACTDLAVSSSAPNKYAYYDFPDLVSPDGVQVGTTYAFAFGITNPTVTTPKKRLFHTWTHAGEWGGLRALLRFAERLMSVSDADHDILRDEFEHVFLLTNTAGMVGGMARGVVETGDTGEDPNRVWGSNPIDRSDVTDTILSIEASVDLLVTEWGVNGSDLLNCAGQIAWHSHTFSSTKFGTYKDGMSANETAFIGYVEAIYGSTLHNYTSSSTGSSTTFARSGSMGGFGVTFEWSYAFADFLNEIGTSVDTIAPALVDTFQAGYFGQEVEPGAEAIEWTGYAPTAGSSGAVDEAPGKATWEWATYAPTANDNTDVSETPGPEAIEWVGYAPSVVAGITLTPGAEVIEWSTYAPTLAVSGGVSETPGAAAWEWLGYAPTISGVSPWTLQAPVTTTWTVQ